MEDRLTYLRDKAAVLPRSPGVYIMHNAAGNVIYVGKSRCLRDRVSQYFHGTHDPKTTKMASSVHDFRFVTCNTEMEALALENSLIKQYTPKYNIKLKDAKSYPYIKISVREQYPRITVTRKRTADGSLYFGPYSSAQTAYSILSSLERTLGIPTCRKQFPEAIGKERPCVFAQIGRCIGLCGGKVSQTEYREIIERAAVILRGGTHETITALTEKMNLASENLEFEEAARCRDSITALRKLGEKQKAVGAPDVECDVIGLYLTTFENTDVRFHDCASVFYIRSGYISDSEHFLFGSDEISGGSAAANLGDTSANTNVSPTTGELGHCLEDSNSSAAANLGDTSTNTNMSPTTGELGHCLEDSNSSAAANPGDTSTNANMSPTTGELVLRSDRSNGSAAANPGDTSANTNASPTEFTPGSESNPGGEWIEEDSPLSAFISGLYQAREYIPKEILLSFELPEHEIDLLTEYISHRAEHRVTIRTPKRGAGKYLCDMATEDAKTHSENTRKRENNTEKILANLASLLCLEVYPTRIEAYDISNLGSEHITAGMITAIDGKFRKSDYRTFKIKNQRQPDDYAAMTEVISRRLAHITEAKEGDSLAEYPDLILLDGGKGHVSVIKELLANLGFDIPVFGMVKDEHHKTRTITTEEDEVNIARHADVFKFIYGLQEEVHRYTVSQMTHAKRKALTTSSLESIKGIGPKKAKLLTEYFSSLKALKTASVEELCEIDGISCSDAEAIYQHFRSQENKGD